MRPGFGPALAAAFILSAGLLAPASVRADDPMQLAVVSYGNIPAGSNFETELSQNTEIANHVDTALKDSLTAHGFHYQPEGTGLVFSINADPFSATKPMVEKLVAALEKSVRPAD